MSKNKQDKSQHIIYDDGSQIWYTNGQPSRKDGPAVIWADGNKAWWLNGKRHCETGPAIEYKDGRKEWYIEGIEYTEEDFNNWLEKKQLNDLLQNSLPLGKRKRKSKI